MTAARHPRAPLTPDRPPDAAGSSRADTAGGPPAGAANVPGLVHRYRPDVFALLLLPHLFLVGRFWGVVDDAFISFRYARNFALGHGLCYNLGEHVPVEGYSNFLWVVLCAVFELFHLDITFWPLLLSAVCGVALLWLLFDTLRRRLEVGLATACLVTLFVGCFPPFAYWSTSGLATMPFALLLFITFERLILRRAGVAGVGAGIAGLLLALTRVEGLAWVAVLLVLALLSRWIAGQRRWRPFLVCVLIVGVGYAIYFAGRYAYYETLLPNTVYAKAGTNAGLLLRGGRYVMVYALTFVSPLIILPSTFFALRRKRIALGLPVAAMAWAFPAYAIAVTGDYMAMGRFLVPGVVFGAILLAWMCRDLSGAAAARRTPVYGAAIALIIIGLLPAWDVHLIPESVRAQFHFRRNAKEFLSEYAQAGKEARKVTEWTNLGHALEYYVQSRALPDPRSSYVAATIGAVGYYSDLFIYDRNGLVSEQVARIVRPADAPEKSPGHDRTVAIEFFLDRRPTILFAMLVAEQEPAAAAVECSKMLTSLRSRPARYRLEEKYVPDFARVPGTDANGYPLYVATWVPLEPGTEPKAAQDAFMRRLAKLHFGRHFPDPRPKADG